MRKILSVATIFLILRPGATLAQQPAAAVAKEAQPSSPKQILEEMVALGSAAARQPQVLRPFQTTFGTGGRGLIVAYLIALHSDREGYAALLKALEARAVKQVGSAPASK